MAAKAAFLLLGRSHPSKALNPAGAAASARCISASAFLYQVPQRQEAPTSSAAPLPPNPSTGSPFYQENWRSPNVAPMAGEQSLVPIGASANARILKFSGIPDLAGLSKLFAGWMTSQSWDKIKQNFEFWIRSLDAGGKLNTPDVHLYNHYLMANLMMNATAGELLDLVAQMPEYRIEPNTASYNLVLKAMYKAQESEAAEKLIDRMLRTSALPDDESYNLVIGLLIVTNQIDSALKYVELTLQSGYMLSSNAFMDCVRSCINAGRLDTLALIIEKCKTTEQAKTLCPSWNLSNYVGDVATQADHSKLAYFSIEFLARWIARGEKAKPPVLLSADEGLIVSALGTAGRTYNSTLLDVAWSVLKHSLRQKRAPNPEAYLAKIYAHAKLGHLQRAFSTLSEFETAYGNSDNIDQDLFSPFTSLNPLVVACCKSGFSTLDSVYVQLEHLSQADPPFKSVAALNCVILGCANIWDLDRAYETFEAISEKMVMTPDIHSYNGLICAFGKLKKTSEASKVFEHLVSIGVKPNATTYSLLVDAHLVNRDPKAALSVIDDMVEEGFAPSKDMLKKLRRRCSREMDFSTDESVQSLSRKFNIGMGNEIRREMLYNLQYAVEY